MVIVCYPDAGGGVLLPQVEMLYTVSFRNLKCVLVWPADNHSESISPNSTPKTQKSGLVWILEFTECSDCIFRMVRDNVALLYLLIQIPRHANLA